MSKKAKIVLYPFILLTFVVGSLFMQKLADVHAEVVQGEGANSQSGVEWHGCEIALMAQNVQQCPTENGKFGGASWHLFKTSNPPYITQDVPAYDDRPIVRKSLIGKGYPGASGKVEDLCKTNLYDYYFAFVYDGWYGYRAWDKKSLVFYGPLDWGTYQQKGEDGTIHHPIYHNAKYNKSHSDKRDHTWSEISAGLANGTNMSKWRVRGQKPRDDGVGAVASDGSSYKSSSALSAWRAWSGDKNATKIPNGTGWFCAGAKKIEIKLTANAIDVHGTLIQAGISSSSAVVKQGNSADLTVNNIAINGYTFKGWRDSVSGAIVATGASYTKSISANTTVYAVYERNTFGGRIVLSGAASGSIPDGNGYTTSSSSSPKYVEIKNCSPTTGCSAVFEDYVKRIAGGGTTPYTVSRTSNLFNTTRGISNSPNVKSDNSGNPNGERVVRDPGSGNYTLYPGMVVCESLAFKVYSTDTDKTTITLCAAATGNAQPPDPSNPGDPSGDTSLYNIRVKNNNVTRYNSWNNTVYAKPNDKLTYMASYYPLLQYTYHLIPGAIKFNSANTIYPANNAVNSNRYLGKDVGAIRSMFNTYRPNSLRNWNNGINVYSSNFATAFNQSYTYTLGELITINRPHTQSNDHTTTVSEVGRKLDETVTTNINNTVNSTPTQVGFALSGNRNIANVITGNASKVASAIVPYNYTTDTKITTADNTTMFAGETFTVNYDYQVKPRYNSLTSNSSSDTYATSVGHPKWRLVMRVVGGDTWTTNEYSDSILSVPINQMKTGRTQQLQTTVNVPDVPAGTRVCMQSQVWPQNSGNADSLNKDGNGQWSVSGEKCFIVAKRPSIQVWGGNVYTQNPITTGVSTKNNIAGGFMPFNINSTSGSSKRVFGSWGELGVIAGSVVSGFGSGASTGFAANNGGNLSPSQLSNPLSNADPGGSDRTDFCLRSQLTFANKCTSGKVGGIGNTSASSNAQNDKTKVLEKIAAGEHTELVGNTVAISDGLAEYTYSGNDLTVQCSGNCNVGSGIKMVRSDKNIAINSNIVYTGRYTELDKIPKVVIYANKVNISCGVTRIDALIIADRTVDTCPDSAGNKINQRKNSNQLVVNGAIIASKLAAHRTYGAATGINSIVPAEIINFDPSLYMWGGDDEDNGGNGDGNDSETGANNLNVTYIRELAPRK